MTNHLLGIIALVASKLTIKTLSQLIDNYSENSINRLKSVTL